MKKSDILVMPQFFDRYINKAEDMELTEALQKYAVFSKEDLNAWKDLGDYVYAPGKWTVKDIFQHIIDNERIQAYRAMRFARNDKTALPGYDEDLLAANTNTKNRTLEDIIEELQSVRDSNIRMFKSFDDEAMLREGICYNTSITPLALGFVLVGHQIHHLKVIKERYLDPNYKA